MMQHIEGKAVWVLGRYICSSYENFKNWEAIRTFDIFSIVKLKGALDMYSIIHWHNLFFQKSWDFISLEVLAWVMTACQLLCSWLNNFWRNMNISRIFYFANSISINIQYSSLWDTRWCCLQNTCAS